jgi:DNA (cytosine-5)-methyltransferase 1
LGGAFEAVMVHKPSFYEFFAGGGMARAGLGEGWRCLFANDFDHKKTETYRANWGSDVLFEGDVRNVSVAHLPESADLIWGSFPCQDLSLAGAGAGLNGARSGSFWPFWRLVKELKQAQRAPKLIVLENVCGALSARGGKDFIQLCAALAEENYRYGALVLDAALFVPQSRPRLFIIALAQDAKLPADLISPHAQGPFHTQAVQKSYAQLPQALRAHWLWWSLSTPKAQALSLLAVIEEQPQDVAWHNVAQTQTLINLMNPLHQEKLLQAQRSGQRWVGALYRRTRIESGVKVQRAEVRFDGVAGCLRTPSGGSSRQYILLVEGKKIRSRLLSARETARLMGLPENYILPAAYSAAYHLTGDGVVAPVVRHIAAHLLEPLIQAAYVRVAA